MIFDTFDSQIQKMTESKRAKMLNSTAWTNETMRWVNIALSLYEWEGLPETCDARTLEKSFLFRGYAMIAREGDAFISPLAQTGAYVNIYKYPATGWGYGYNGFNKEYRLFIPGGDESRVVTETQEGPRGGNDAVLWYDNPEAYPYINYILEACGRLSDIKRTADVIRSNLKSPVIVSCQQAELKSTKDAFRMRDENQRVIILASDSTITQPFQVWNMGQDPGVLQQLAEDYDREENRLREIFGIHNSSVTDKRERLSIPELNTNYEATQTSLDVRLEMRKRFCELVNDCFALNISVKWRGEDAIQGMDTGGDMAESGFTGRGDEKRD